MSRVCAVARRRRVGACVLSGLAAAVAASVCLEPGPALAFDDYSALEPEPPAAAAPAARKIRRRAAKPPAREAKRAEALDPERPLFAVISIGNQSISIYNHRGLVERSMVSTGMPGHPTPEGVFTIIGRERMHHSNLYSNAPMPFMQRITWSGVAMHLGVVPGHPASHGCIRLPGGFAAKLWGLTRIGERVVISPHELSPGEISHPALPSPKMQSEAQAEKPASDAAAEPRLLDPRKYAEKLIVEAAAAPAAAGKDAKDADAAIAGARQEIARAATEARAAEAAHAAAKAKAEAAARSFEAARVAAERPAVAAASPESAPVNDGKAETARDAAATAKTAAEAALADAQAKLDAARAAAAAKAAEFAGAVQRAREATLALSAATRAEKDARLRTAPISVLVSKKDRKVYVRQGLAPLFDAPVTIRDPEIALGSHLFIATATEGGGTDLKWSVVSLPARYAEARGERRKKGLVEERSASRGPASTAAEALDRIEMAQDVRDRIAERLWLGGSMIVSDQPPSAETGAVGTDLTVKLR
ncbi:L,D-transpeptidase family protein [Methylosinus sp. Sm6]|uniref:L,D-transpeptidase family protein n=1 Tax=Methylosinus sp. Sm6 TaxID=2866948 RepID=UPI001C99F89C|nr:L,D-transpeptidase family protein [Methylosinus sp. Sm6]MBY6243641.1 L,D-transpeptidase family protein [Methylosinus sp. Sm6]